jgi:hypothetical protein
MFRASSGAAETILVWSRRLNPIYTAIPPDLLPRQDEVFIAADEDPPSFHPVQVSWRTDPSGVNFLFPLASCCSNLRKAFERLIERAVGERQEAFHAAVAANTGAGRAGWNSGLDPCPDRDEPVLALPEDRDMAHSPFGWAALEETDPTDLGEENRVAVQLEPLRVPEGSTA